MTLKLILLILVATILVRECKSQDRVEIFSVGQTADYLLNDLEYYTKRKADLKDFRGKWLILDFWTRQCAPCIKSFPKINDLQKEFDNEVQFVLVGINNQYNWELKSFYAGAKTAQGLKLPVAYDSVLWKKFRIETVPRLVLINPNGIVKKIMATKDLDSAALKEIIKQD